MENGERVAEYTTETVQAGWLARVFPSLAFYARVTPVVLRNARAAKRGRFDRAMWRSESVKVLRAFEHCGVPVTFENLGVLEGVEGPCVFVGNHMSTTETFLLAAFIVPYRPITFVVKRQLVEYPVFKHIMRACDPVVVGRENPKEDFRVVMEEGCKRLESGVSVIVFPQRTRSARFSPDDFNTIGVKLARRAGVPVVPLALKTDAWANGCFIKDFGPLVPDRPVHFALGAPLSSALRDREANQAVIDFIQAKLNDWTPA
ncbi:MAG: 1-acyl-sn-glycerol-3-phosphate acyltransferase [Opitutales bacterium]|nr:1-acyl-sn-glycerol-3-phosphate acyltransferase [Opitutales bacterium]